jgi:transcriptional adapter 3
LEVWQSDPDVPFHGSPAPGPHPDLDNCVPRGSADGLRDDQLETIDLVSAGPLAERVLSALVEEKVTTEDNNQNEKDNDAVNSLENGGGGQSWRVAVSKADYASFEERLKGELKYIGLLTMSEDGLGNTTDDLSINWNNREDDEICQELRKLQKQLRQQSLENAARKMILEKKVEEQLAYQEYATILDDLDKQVGDAFNKRTKSIKAKKKRSIGGAGGGSSAGAGGVAGKSVEKSGIGDGAKAIIERRRRWIEKVGPVFRPIEKFIRVPTTQEGGSVYDDLDEYIQKAEEEAKMEELRMVEETN